MVVLVAQQVLAPEQHLQPGVGHILADIAQPLPDTGNDAGKALVAAGPEA